MQESLLAIPPSERSFEAQQGPAKDFQRGTDFGVLMQGLFPGGVAPGFLTY